MIQTMAIIITIIVLQDQNTRAHSTHRVSIDTQRNSEMRIQKQFVTLAKPYKSVMLTDSP